MGNDVLYGKYAKFNDFLIRVHNSKTMFIQKQREYQRTNRIVSVFNMNKQIAKNQS